MARSSRRWKSSATRAGRAANTSRAPAPTKASPGLKRSASRSEILREKSMLATKTALTIEAAKAIAAACEAAARKDRLKLVIAIVDDGGHLVLLHRDDGAQVGSVEIAILKARTAVLFKRP